MFDAGQLKDALTELDLGEHSIYQELDQERKEIRLLVLLKAQLDEPIYCRLQHTYLDADPTPPYETISYVWGDRTVTELIAVNDHGLKVPASARRVLQRFRLPDKDRVLWIDAVCINQQDIAERGRQVALMAQIYSKPTRGLVWLGEDAGFAAGAKAAVEAVLRDAKQETNDLADFGRKVYDSDKGGLQFAQDGLSVDIDHGSLLRLYDTPWWKRLWCLQEASLPAQSLCVCGAVEMELVDVLRTARWLAYKRHRLPFVTSESLLQAMAVANYADHVHGLFRGPFGINVPLHELLHKARARTAYDSRDYVYGILGMYLDLARKEVLPEELTPNYTRQSRDVLRDATRFAILEVGKLDCFAYASCRPSDSEERLACPPSWVPRWDMRWDVDLDADVLSDAFNAHGSRDVDQDVTKGEEDVLPLKGFIVGKIALRSGTYGKRILIDPIQLLKLAREAEDVLERVRSEQRGSEPRSLHEGALAMTLCAGADADDMPTEPDDALRRYSTWKQYLSDTGRSPNLRELGPENSEEMELAADYDQSIYYACYNRCFFVTTDGRPGLGPQTLEIGDEVAILYGCRWPVVLRKKAAADCYEFLEIAYVYGIMLGEAVREHEAAGKADEVIKLL